ncbi:hypothetical protein Ancab_016393 [Ancistrocladus abbreviatus]
MEGSISVICNFQCSKFNLDQTLLHFPLSPHSTQANFQFIPTSSRQSGSRRHENNGGRFINPRCLIKSFSPIFSTRSRLFLSQAHSVVPSLAIVDEEKALNKSIGLVLPNVKDEMLPKIDKVGGFVALELPKSSPYR